MEIIATEGASIYIWLALSVAGGLIAITRRKRLVEPFFDHLELWYCSDHRWFLHLWSHKPGVPDTWQEITQDEAQAWLVRMDDMKAKVVATA